MMGVMQNHTGEDPIDHLAEIEADLVTPLSAYLQLRDTGHSFLLESVEQGRLGRYSFVGAGTRLVGLEEAEVLHAKGAAVIGYLGYDYVAGLEPVDLVTPGPNVAESAFIVADTLVRFDHPASRAHVLLGRPEAITSSYAPKIHFSDQHDAGDYQTLRTPSREAYEEMVLEAKRHIVAGDVFQIVLSQRAQRATSSSAVDLYRSLRRVNPSPYMFLLELGPLSVIGSSPETLVKRAGARATVNPIAGTAAVGHGDTELLLASDKDRAEHMMLVDLARNDLSRVCLPGTVNVERLLVPERFSHVVHLVSEVTGELRAGVSSFDLLRACVPAGTVSGAPKVRAMQIISELEGYRRGIYGGAVGYALPGDSFDACIAIRTMVLQDGIAYLQAGAGIVAESDPTAEHNECLAKLGAIEAAIELSEQR
jgi:anthranilate synthase component 1